MTILSKVAVNPLPWLLSRQGYDLSPASARAAVAGIAEAGFTAMHSAVPEGMPPAEYLALLSDHGVRPAPGYFAAYFAATAHEFADAVEAAKRHAESQAELGLGQTFLADELIPARIASPGIGADFNAARLELVIERIAIVAETITAQGVTPCFHPHVGSWIETEYEVRATLDAIDAATMAFGPDIGHLFWAGADPAKLIGDYASRVGAVHIKDVHRRAADGARESNADYDDATYVQHVFTEPGRGDIDFDAVFAAMPASFAGWYVIEVDVPDLPTKEESTAQSARWVGEQRLADRTA